MKNLYLLFLMIAFSASAQTVNIPDGIFKMVLVQNPAINLNGDSEIQVSEALTVNYVDISTAPVADLTGIEAFVNLEEFYCSNTELTSIDLSMMLNLKVLHCTNLQGLLSLVVPNSLMDLHCYWAGLTTLNLSNATNLVSLYCSGNQLTTLDLSQSPQLENLVCSSNNIQNLIVNPTSLKFLVYSGNGVTSFDATAYTQLETLHCFSNGMVNLNVTGLSQLKVLNISDNEIVNLNLTGLSALESLSITDNPIATINLTGLMSLAYLETSQTNMTTLAISDLPMLNNLVVNNNELLTAVTLNNVPQLKDISCGGNPLLDTLTVTGANIIEHIGCGENNLTSIDTSNLPELMSLYCGSNNITALDLTNNPKLTVLYCPDNLLTTIDVSTNFDFCMLECDSNPLLTSIFMKNGINSNCEEFGSFSNCPNLEFVCADDADVLGLINYFGTMGMNVNVNTYCSFEPGGNYNTISGNIKFDSDSNGCDTTDLVFDNVKVNLVHGTESYATFTSGGDYKFFTQTGDYTISAAIENPAYFVINPTSSTINFPAANNTITNQNFCIIPNGTHQDLEIVVAPIVPARPGFNAVYEVVYRNKGNQTMSLDYGVMFFYDQNKMSFVSSSVAPSTNGPGALTWDYSNLKPFEARSVLVTMSINPPTHPTDPVNIDDVLTFNSTINPIGTDESQLDNYGAFNQVVVGSYDPNDIQCVEGQVLAPAQIGNYLHYVIRFENTGNYPAQNIVVKTDINPADFDIQTLQLLNASHPVDARVKNNTVEFIFENIMLDSGGHGNILLKVKSKPNLVTGDSVQKMANIFFDYNFPVATNDAETVFENLNVGGIKDNTVAVYPNPVDDKFTINANSDLRSVQLYDVQGRLLMTRIIDQKETTMSISAYPSGIYFLKIYTQTGTATQKIVKK